MSDEPEMNDVIRRELDRREQAKRELLFPPTDDTINPDNEEKETDDQS